MRARTPSSTRSSRPTPASWACVTASRRGSGNPDEALARRRRANAQSGSVRRTGKEDGREYELKPSIVVQRVQLPPGKGQSASRKPALRVTAMVARSVGEQVPQLRESASK